MTQITPDLAATAIGLRASHPAAPARDVLDLVMHGRSGALTDFGDSLKPGYPFALLVAEAIDGEDMMPAWSLWAMPGTAPGLEYMLNQRWRSEIMPRFAEAYGLTGTTTGASLAGTGVKVNRPRRLAA